MRKARRKVGEEGEAENRFQRLPDDIVLHILCKLSNVKWLCRCFVVGKRFSSLIPLVQTVSFDVKTWNSVSLFGNEEGSAYVEGRSFERIFSDPSIENLITEHDLLYPPQPRLPHLVFHFKHIQYLNIELPSIHNNANNACVSKLGANFTRNLGSFTFLSAASLSKADDEKGGQETGYGILDHGERIQRVQVQLALDCVQKVALWLVGLKCKLEICSMLQSVTITDLKNPGLKLCLSGEKLKGYSKGCQILKAILRVVAPGTIRIGYVPVLPLPVSGYVMKGVIIVHINPFALDAFDGTAMVDAFAEEKGVCFEAVAQIVEKHMGTIILSTIIDALGIIY